MLCVCHMTVSVPSDVRAGLVTGLKCWKEVCWRIPTEKSFLLYWTYSNPSYAPLSLHLAVNRTFHLTPHQPYVTSYAPSTVRYILPPINRTLHLTPHQPYVTSYPPSTVRYILLPINRTLHLAPHQPYVTSYSPSTVRYILRPIICSFHLAFNHASHLDWIQSDIRS